MNAEMLETLLLDRSLGELSPEVAALLDEHLAQHPDAARRAAELAATVAFARGATRTTASVIPPALDFTRLQPDAPADRVRLRPRHLLPLAACLALGAVAGYVLHPGSAQTAVAASAPVAVTTPPPVASTAGLWSRTRLTAQHEAARLRLRETREAPGADHPESRPFSHQRL